jgi:hypothetical protein
VANIAIINAVVDARAADAAAIGSASSVGVLVVRNGSYAVSGTVGFAAAALTFGTATVGLTAGLVPFTCRVDGPCLSGGELSVSSVHMKALTNSATFGGPWTGPVTAQHSDFLGHYQARSATDSFGPLSMLHFGQIKVPGQDVNRLTVREHGSTMVLRTIEFSPALAQGIIFMVSPGTYEVLVDHPEGYLYVKDKTVFEVPQNGEAFFDEVTHCVPAVGISVAATVGIAVISTLLAGGIAVTVCCLIRRTAPEPVEVLVERGLGRNDHRIDSESTNAPTYTTADP